MTTAPARRRRACARLAAVAPARPPAPGISTPPPGVSFLPRAGGPHLTEVSPQPALPRFAWIVVVVAGVGGRRAEPDRTGHERTLPHAGLQHRADHARRPGLPPRHRARRETRRPLPGLRAREPGRPQPLPPAPGRLALARAGARGRGRRAPAWAPGHAGERGHGATLGPGPAAARAGAAARRRRGRLGGAQGAHLRYDPGGPRAPPHVGFS